MTTLSTDAAHAYVAAIDLEAIAALSDPIGVLSVYVDADPALVAGSRPAWQAPVRTGLRRLVNDTRQTRPRAERLAFAARLRELEPELDALLDPRLGGRGRALFAAITGSDFHRVDLRARLTPLVCRGSTGRATPRLQRLIDLVEHELLDLYSCNSSRCALSRQSAATACRQRV